MGEFEDITDPLRDEMGYPDLRTGHYEDVERKKVRKMPDPVSKVVVAAMPDITRAQEMAVIVFCALVVVLAFGHVDNSSEITALGGSLIFALTGSDAVHRHGRNKRLSEENSATIHSASFVEAEEA